MGPMSDSRTPRRPPAASDPRLEALAEDSGYEVLGRIGTGGMGIVYRAHDADGNDDHSGHSADEPAEGSDAEDGAE